MTQTSHSQSAPLFTEYDPYDSAVPAVQVRTQYDQMRSTCPVVHVPNHGGFDVVTGFDTAREVAANPKVFSSADGSFILPSGFPPIPPLDFDDPEHRRWVKLMQRPLTLGAVKELAPTITEIVDRHIDTFAAKGEADLFAEFAEPIPVNVIGRMVGLSADDAVTMREVAINVFAAIGTDDFPRCWSEFTTFTDAQLESRRREPQGDYLSQLASGQLDGEAIDDQGSAGILVALLVGGHHSTASALAGLVHHVLTTPGLRQRLADEPDIVDDVVEESLRLTTPLQYFARTATSDIEVAGCPVPAGRRVAINFGAANRDPAAYDRPHEFDPDRDRNHHLAFGHGIHLCIGRHLARAELRIALTRLLERLPDLAPAGDPIEPGYVGTLMFSLVSLPVRFSPAA